MHPAVVVGIAMLVAPRVAGLQFTVKNVQGEQETFDVEASCTIWNLARMYQHRTIGELGNPAKIQFIFHGKMMKPDSSLSDYTVGNGAMLHVIPRKLPSCTSREITGPGAHRELTGPAAPRLLANMKTVQRQMDDVRAHPTTHYEVNQRKDYSGLMVSIQGPVGSPYEGGVFYGEIGIPPGFPFKPPTFHFRTPIYHPNVKSHGAICLNMIRDNDWSVTTTFRKILDAIVDMLANPTPGTELASMGYTVGLEEFKNDRATFDKTAKEWTQKYAMGSAARLYTSTGAVQKFNARAGFLTTTAVSGAMVGAGVMAVASIALVVRHVRAASTSKAAKDIPYEQGREEEIVE